eukprot:2200489-Ditylum_brightwellii.AAC.1
MDELERNSSRQSSLNQNEEDRSEKLSPMNLSKKLGRLKSPPPQITPSQPRSFLKVRSEEVEVVPILYPGENLNIDQSPQEESLTLSQQPILSMETPAKQIKKCTTNGSVTTPQLLEGYKSDRQSSNSVASSSKKSQHSSSHGISTKKQPKKSNKKRKNKKKDTTTPSQPISS